jgi:hypothetical protein
MKKSYNDLYLKDLISLPPELYNILNVGCIKINDCLLFKNPYDLQSESISNFPDKTGYECFVNKIHIDNFSENPLPAAISLAVQLLKQFHNYNLRTIISYDDLSCVLRFHIIRNNESWLNSDIEKYKEEGILIIDSKDLV